jgi:hypothetical protein
LKERPSTTSGEAIGGYPAIRCAVVVTCTGTGMSASRRCGAGFASEDRISPTRLPLAARRAPLAERSSPSREARYDESSMLTAHIPPLPARQHQLPRWRLLNRAGERGEPAPLGWGQFYGVHEVGGDAYFREQAVALADVPIAARAGEQRDECSAGSGPSLSARGPGRDEVVLRSSWQRRAKEPAAEVVSFTPVRRRVPDATHEQRLFPH